MPQFSSEILWLFAIGISSVVIFIGIIDRFSKRKIDNELKEFIQSLATNYISQNKSAYKDFLGALDKSSSQSELRTATVCAILKTTQDKVEDGNTLINKVYEIIIADPGWGIQLRAIDKEVQGIARNSKLLDEMIKMIMVIKEIETEINARTKETNGIIKSNYGCRSADIMARREGD